MKVFAAIVLMLGAACSGAAIRASSDVIKTELERARRSGAMRCAPRELATAEANLDFALGELDEGNWWRAQDHIGFADVASKKALSLSKDCAPRQVVIKEQIVVKIEDADADGDGVIDRDDACPRLPGPVDNKGCPLEAPRDRDGDGVPDNVDRCPDQAEDVDGYQDEDGCPELDNDSDGVMDTSDKCPNEAGPIVNLGCPVTDRDGDGITDEKDQCPNEPEDKDAFQDDDGCPDLDNDADGVPDTQDDCPNEFGSTDNKGCPKKYSLVAVTKERIEIKKQINFATGSAKMVGAISQQILKEIAQALSDTPRIKKLRIEGHTDSVGDDAKNLRLSQQRADSVTSALIKLGVDPGRMEALGFGETKPIASNSNASGRAENRRTEFNITEQ